MWTQLFWPHNVAASAMNRMADSSWRAFGARGSRTSRKIDNTGCIGGLPNQETPSESTFIPLATAPLHKCEAPAVAPLWPGLLASAAVPAPPLITSLTAEQSWLGTLLVRFRRRPDWTVRLRPA